MTANESSPPPPDRAGKWRRRGRRIRRILLWLLALAVVLRIALAIAMPWIVGMVASAFDLECRYDRLELSLLGLDVEVRNLEVAPPGASDPLVELEYARVDVAVLELLTGKLVVRRLEVDGLDVRVRRDRDGNLDFARHFASASPVPEPAPEIEKPAERTEDPAPPDFSSPVRIDAIRLQHVHVHVRDETCTPPQTARFDVNVRISHIGHPVRDVRIEAELNVPHRLDGLHFEGRVRHRARELDADLTARLAGLHPAGFAAWLAPLGIEPRADSVDGEMRMKVRARAAEDPPAGLSADVEVTAVRARADGAEFFALGQLAVHARGVGPAGGVIARIALDHLRARARREQTGGIGVAGFALLPRSESPTSEAVPAASTGPRPPGRRVVDWRVEEVTLRDVVAEVQDDSVSPAARLGVELERLELRPDKEADRGSRVEGALAAPGLFERLKIEGRASLDGPRKTLECAVDTRGITLDGLAPFLGPAGMTSTLRDATMTCRFDAALESGPDGGVKGSAGIHGVRFADARGEELLRLETLRATDVTQEPAANRLRVESVEVFGGRLPVVRQADGTLLVLGMRIGTPPPAAAAAAPREAKAGPPARPVPGSPATTVAGTAAPSIEIGRILVDDHAVSFRDDAVQPENTVRLANLGLELKNLIIGPPGNRGEPAPIRLWARAPGLIDRFEATGTLRAAADAADLELELVGEGAGASSVAPYLRTVGAVPKLADGHLRGRVSASIRSGGGDTSVDAAFSDLAFTDGKMELAAVDSVRVEKLVLAADAIGVSKVEIARPRVRVARTADGRLRALGFEVVPPVPALSTRNPAAGDPGARPGREPEPTKSQSPDAPGPAPAPAAPVIRIGSVAVTGAEAHWHDDAVTPPVRMTGSLDLALEELVIGRDAPPARLSLEGSVPETLDHLAMTGSLALGAGRQEGRLSLEASGLRPGPLQAYLPSAAAIRNGRFRAALTVRAEPHPDGGERLALSVEDVAFAEDGAESPALAVDRIAVVADRIDPAGRRIAIEEVTLAGLVADVERTAEGMIQVCGIPLPAGAKQDAATENDAAESPPAAAPVREAPSTPVRPGALPLVSLERLEVGVDRLRWTDRSDPEAAPLVIRDVRLVNSKPIELLGEEPDRRPPVLLRLEGEAAPVVKRFRVDLEAVPFAAEPQLKIGVSARGIAGAGLTQLRPALGAWLDGAPLTDGRFGLESELVLLGRRRHALDFAFPDGFGFEFEVRDIAFRDGESGPLLAGVKEVRVVGDRVDPARGAADIRLVEIVQPAAAVKLDEAGLHVLGLVVRMPAPEAAPVPPEAKPEPTAGAGPPPDPPAEPPRPAGRSARGAGEIRVKRFLVTGLDFTLEDRTVDPPLSVPLTDLDVSVTGLTSGVAAEPVPVRFDVRIAGGKVSLARRHGRSMLGGAIADAANVVTGRTVETHGQEQRPLFQEFLVQGELFLSPRPHGWVKTDLNLLELGALKGAAARAGAVLDDGLLDSSVTAVLEEDGDLVTDARFVLTDLSLSEPPDGPIVRYLGLPAPLATVLFVLRDQGGVITAPLGFRIDSEAGLSTGAVVQQSMSALASMISDAIAASPFRVAGTFTDLTGLTGGDSARSAGEPVSLAFAPGDTALCGAERPALETLVARMRQRPELAVTLVAEIGRDDLERARIRANPSAADCRSLVTRLRRRKESILEARGIDEARARAAVATGLDEEAQRAIRRLRACDRELGLLEKSLDQIGELLRPGAERHAARRTRAAAMAIASARLRVVHRALVDAGGPSVADRLRLRRPRFEAEPEHDRGGVRMEPVLRLVN